MSTIELLRRGTPIADFSVSAGGSLFDCLIAHHIPPKSVAVTCNGNQLSVHTQLIHNEHYVVNLLEGYDIQSIRKLYSSNPEPETIHTDHQLSFDENGSFLNRIEHHDEESFLTHVERRVYDTVKHYDLLSSGQSVLVGLSGETDSAGMVLALSELESELNIDLEAVTMKEPRGEASAGFRYAQTLAEEFDIPHRTVELDEIESLYGLETNIRSVFKQLGSSTYDKQTVTVMDTVHRRVFEYIAAQQEFDRICLGEHLTEFVSRILDTTITGIKTQSLVRNQVGPHTYVYPVALLDKVTLALYHELRTGTKTPTSSQIAWDSMPDEQNYSHYLADMLRSYWPGIGHWLIETQYRSTSPYDQDAFECCSNCGKHILKNSDGPNQCLPCQAFEAVGAI